MIPLALLAVALFSRLYDLSSFPHFTLGLPMCGDYPPCSGQAVLGLPGLYTDEFTNLMHSFSFGEMFSDVGGGPVSPLLIALSTHIIGVSAVGIRLPFAIVSSVSALLVYFTSNEITGGSKSSAILSALYFIVMMPALVYGRMAIGENLIALFFIITFFATLKIKRESSSSQIRLWFVIAAIFSALSIIVKLDGAFVALYFLLFLYKARLLRRGYPYLGLTLVLGGLLPLGLLEITGRASFFKRTHTPFSLRWGTDSIFYRTFFLDTLPSGVPIFWNSTTQVDTSGLFTPEFWYIFLYIVLGA